MAPVHSVSRFARIVRTPAVLLALVALLAPLVAACAQDAQRAAEPTAGEPTAEPATGPDPSPTGAPAPTGPEANLTEGCVEQHVEGTDYFPDKAVFEEATSVAVSYHGNHKVVEVTAPDLPEGSSLRYVLVQCGTPAPELEGDLADAQVIEVPVREVVSLTTTNLPHFAELGIVDRLVGVGTGAFVVTPEVLERIESGELPDFADSGGQPDLERLVAAGPDLLLMDGFGDTLLDDVRRFTDAGVPVAIDADFNERTLLGRAEWLKFTSLFTNTERAAEDVYAGVRDRYEERREYAAQFEERPRVLVNTPYEGTWFVPGGDSFLANAIADAGGEYVFAEAEGTYSHAYDIETVLDTGADADVWIQAGSVNGTLDDLLAVDERFGSFRALAEGEVWAWDAWVTEGGGYAIFEVAYTRADLLLDDLVAALHPEARDDIDLTFYGQVPPAE
jgi:iron complex transport system substrate-binding protein